MSGGVSNPAGPITWASEEDRLLYIQRVAEMNGSYVVKTAGTYAGTRPGINFAVSGGGITVAAVDSNTTNDITVTLTSVIQVGSGAPSGGSNGDFYFRTDTPGTSNQRLYVKSAGSWTGIL